MQPVRDRIDCRIEIWPTTIADFNIPVIAKSIIDGDPDVFWEFKVDIV